MPDERKSKDELVRILHAGGGWVLNEKDAGKSVLKELAEKAAQGGATLIFQGLQGRDAEEMVEIARAGKGKVIFA
jgi:hypothetical protein